ncbi:leucine-rich repeat domain-containing protein [Bradyrhizobium sp. AT1]|uniref:leucine-rich repeat domain-containing protein n=1 Tax=Bradyrhizobium sp. AT1 TaxID=574934 RepID=UPI000A03FB0F|nr:leucine-rich repeat domain-containing protein [Bradyrhizobium sp. AT1]
MNAQSAKAALPYKFSSPTEAYKVARRRITNNALRRKQASIDLSNFGLTELPPEIGQLTSLHKLDISNNQLTMLPPELGKLASLWNLDASVNKLVSIPSEIGELKKLTGLDLQKNKLRDLPASIGGLLALSQLLLNNNNLTSLPREIGALTALLILDLDENELGKLPTEIGNLKQLLRLTLDSNQLSELPDSICQLTELRHLDADNNKLTRLPPHFSKLQALTRVYLNVNHLSEFPAALTELPHLRSLMVAHNQIVSIPANISKMSSLRRLYLGQNLLATIPPQVAELDLDKLDLSRNRLRDLPNSLGKMKRLEDASQKHGNNPGYGLSIEQNPLIEPLPILIAPGQPTSTFNALAWLRGEIDPASLENPVSKAQRVPPPPEPSEEAGPQFRINENQIDLLQSVEESSSFDFQIQAALHKRLQRQASLLYEATKKVSNQHPQLLTVVAEYAELTRPNVDQLDIVNLWAAGNALMAQAASFGQQDKARTFSEPLEPVHFGLLSEVAALHGGFILGFPLAQQLTSRADQARIGPETVRAIAPSTSKILSALSRQRRLFSERARNLIEALDASLLSGSWDAARIGYTSYATVRNALVTIGRLCIWMNDKGGSLVGGALVASAVSASNLPPDTAQLLALFIQSNSADLLSFAAPFPEVRTYLAWIVDHFDAHHSTSKDAASDHL